MSYREQIEAALRRDVRQSDRTIAAAVGCSWRWVRAVRSLLYADGTLTPAYGQRTRAALNDPELDTLPLATLAERHGLPTSYLSRLRRRA